MDESGQHYLKYVVFPAGHESSKRALLRALGDKATLQQVFSMSDDELLKLPGFGLRKLVAVHRLKEAESITNLGIFDAKTRSIQYPEKTLEYLGREEESRYKPLFELLSIRLGPNVTLSEIAAMEDIELLEIHSFGKGKLQLLREYLRQTGHDTNCCVPTHYKELDIKLEQDELKAPISSIVLPENLKLRLNYVVSQFEDIETIEDLLRLDFSRVRTLSGFGKKKLEDFKQTIQGVADGSYLIDYHTEASDDTDSSLSAYPLTFVEKSLKGRLERFIAALSERERYVFVHRLGIESEKKTLEDIAQSLPNGRITRERVRQLELKSIRQWLTQCGLLSSRLWFTLQENLVLGKQELLPNLRRKFSDESDFYRFLALTCDRSDKELLSVVSPKIPYSLLDTYWLNNSSPAPLVNVVNYLKDELAYDDAVARNIIYRATEEGRLDVSGDNVSPLKLSKPYAVVNTLLDFKSGAKWEVIHRRANEKNISNTQLPEGRLDAAIITSVDSGHVYQSARGEYCHTSFLCLDEKLTDSILKDIRDELVEQQHLGRSALHLMADYYRHRSLPIDYFVVRHIVRSNGEQVGVFFSGKSGADTISLDSTFSAISQLKAIEDFLLSSRKAVSKYDVSRMIRSGSVGHATFYLERLSNQGKVVYLGNERYGSPKLIYDNVDIESILLAANSFLAHERRILDVAILTKRLNRKLGLNHDKYFYFGLLKIYAEKYGYEWFFGSYCLATHELEFWSISASVRHFIAEGILDADELLNEIDKYFLFEPSTAKFAISNVLGAKRRETQEVGHISEDHASKFEKSPTHADDTYAEQGIYEPLTISQQRQLKKFVEKELCIFDESNQNLWVLRLFVLRYFDANGYTPLAAQFMPADDGSARVPILETPSQLAEALNLQRDVLEQFILDGDDEGAYRYLLTGYLNLLRESFAELFTEEAIKSLVNDFGSLTKTDSILRKFSSILTEGQVNSLRSLNDVYIWASSRKNKQSQGFKFNQTLLDNWLLADKEEYCNSLHQSPETLKVLVWPSTGGYVLSSYFRVLVDVYRNAGFRRRDIAEKVVNKNLYAKVDSELDLFFTITTIALSAISFDRRLLGTAFFTNNNVITINDTHLNSGNLEFDRVVLYADTTQIINFFEAVIDACGASAKIFVQTKKESLIDPNLGNWRRSVLDKRTLKSLDVSEDDLGVVIKPSSPSKPNCLRMIEYRDGKVIRNDNFDASLFLELPNCELGVFSPNEVVEYFSFERKRLGDLYNFRSVRTLKGESPTMRYWFELFEEAPDSSFDGWYMSGRDFVSWIAEPLHLIDVVREKKRGTIDKLSSKSFLVNGHEGLRASWVRENVYYSTESGCILESNGPTFGMADSWLLLDFFHKLVALGQLSSKDKVSSEWLLKLPVARFETKDFLDSYKEEVARLNYRRESSPVHIKPKYLSNKGQPLQESFEITYREDCERAAQVSRDIEELRRSMLQSLRGTNFEPLVGNVVAKSELRPLDGDNNREQVFFEYATMLVSFAIGCMFNRYDKVSNPSDRNFKKVTILPLTDRPFFEEDATSMLHTWVKSIVGEKHIAESWHFLNAYLSLENFSSSAIRNYINDKFFYDHRNTFLGKPIYWRICSGPYRAFECLVYVHRFDETILPKVRIDYLQPLITKYEKLLEDMSLEQENASSISEKIALKEEEKLLRLRIAEAQKFDTKLKFAADARFAYRPDSGIQQEIKRLKKLGLEVQ